MTHPCGPHEHAPLDRILADPVVVSSAAGYFRAMGDPGRLTVLAALRDGETCVTELASALQVELPALSQRLRVLRQAGLVRSRRDGRHIYYTLHDDHVVELLNNALAHASEEASR
jgi:DNA-binding transcriptional ArsR family regulator